MASLPITTGRAVAPNATPQLRAPVQAFGGGSAARPVDLSGTANLAADIYHQERQQADQIAVLDAASKLSTLETDRLWNEKDGALNARGKDAFGVPERLAADWEKGVSDIEKGLTTDGQKIRFRQAAQAHWNAVNEQVTSHVAKERVAYANERTTSYVEAELNAAIASFADPKRVDESIANQVAAITDQGRRAGKSPEWIAEHTQKVTSQTRYNVLRQYLDTGKDLAGSQYFEQHKRELRGADLINAERLTEAGSVRAASQQAADRIGKETTDLTAGLAAAAQIADPRVRDETEDRVRRHFADIAVARRQKQQDALDKANDIIEQTNGDIDKVPLSLRVDMSPSDLRALRHTADGIRNPKDPGNPDAFMHYASLNGLNPAATKEFLNLNVLKVAKAEGLSNGEAMRLLSMQRVARGQDVRGDATEERRAAAHAAEAEKLRFERENALLKAVNAHGGMGANLSADDKKALDAEVKRIKQHYNALQAAEGIAPVSATVSPQAGTAPHGDVDFRAAGVLHPLTPVPEAWQARVLADPKYKKFLADGGYDVGSVKPLPVAK
ncbi:MAG: hypothetical protein JWL61_5004 [Gemmatimonadetes bacterium]|nr:hypothetical protein [Gemmatimonadota bacterium]